MGDMTVLQNSWIGKEDAKIKILALVKKTAKSQFEIGVVLKGCKDKIAALTDTKMKTLAEMEYDELITELPFGKTVANKFVQIASDTMIKKYIEVAPIAYNTLYGMIGLTEETWKYFKEEGLTSFSSGKDVTDLKTKYQEETAEPDAGGDAPAEPDAGGDAPAEPDAGGDAPVAAPVTGNDKQTPEMDTSDFVVEDDKVDLVLPASNYIVVSVMEKTISGKDMEKLDDLVAYIEKLNFADSNTVKVDVFKEEVVFDIAA